MSVLELLGGLDWWQLGWLFAGLFFVLLLGTLLKSRGFTQKGYEAGYHDRQHWETDRITAGKLERP